MFFGDYYYSLEYYMLLFDMQVKSHVIIVWIFSFFHFLS